MSAILDALVIERRNGVTAYEALLAKYIDLVKNVQYPENNAAYGNKNSLALSGAKAILTVRKDSTPAQRENFVREWYRDLLKAEVARLLPKWEQITGLRPDGWQTKYMTTRWGTCNTTTRKLWLNLQLAKKTPECLEYIILHELIHLAEKNHNERFVSLMDKYMPMWREVKATLNGQTLDFME